MELTRLDITKMLGIVYLESGQAISDIDLERRIDFWYAALSGYDREIVMEAFKNVALETNYPIKLANINDDGGI